MADVWSPIYVGMTCTMLLSVTLLGARRITMSTYDRIMCMVWVVVIIDGIISHDRFEVAISTIFTLWHLWRWWNGGGGGNGIRRRFRRLARRLTGTRRVEASPV